MSTRSELDFVVQNEIKGETLTSEEYRRVYRHWDGYPDCVIPDLKEFLAWNGGRNTDVEYATANFLYWSKKKQVEQDIKWQKKRGKPVDKEEIHEQELLGFGVCDQNEFHGDIEYYYRVISNNGKPNVEIEVYEVERENWNDPITMKNMKLIKKEVVKCEKETD